MGNEPSNKGLSLIFSNASNIDFTLLSSLIIFNNFFNKSGKNTMQTEAPTKIPIRKNKIMIENNFQIPISISIIKFYLYL